MKAPATLVLVRHGETLWNRSGRYQGHFDSPLTPRGEAQARAVAESLHGRSFGAFYSSDLGRARQTSLIIADRIGKRFLTDARLREQHYGLLQGQDVRRAKELDPVFFEKLHEGDPDYAPRGGESRRQRHKRALEVLEEIAARHSGERILVVTHGGIVDSLFRETLKIDFRSPRRYSLYNAAINQFVRREDRWVLQLWGDVGHLDAAGTTDAGDSFTAA